MFDLNHAVDWLVGVVVAIMGWFMREQHGNIKEIHAKFDELPEVYARRDDTNQLLELIRTDLRRIENKLDRHNG